MSHLEAAIAKARAEGRIKDAEAMERIELDELRKKRRMVAQAKLGSKRHG